MYLFVYLLNGRKKGTEYVHSYRGVPNIITIILSPSRIQTNFGFRTYRVVTAALVRDGIMVPTDITIMTVATARVALD